MRWDSDNRARFIGMTKLFISYRRDDSADIAGRIYDRLVAKFGEEAVF
jgi:hypothetical protein